MFAVVTSCDDNGSGGGGDGDSSDSRNPYFPVVLPNGASGVAGHSERTSAVCLEQALRELLVSNCPKPVSCARNCGQSSVLSVSVDACDTRS